MKKLIETNIVVTLAESKAETIQALLDELEEALKEKGITLGSYSNGRFYHHSTLSWFPDVKISKYSRSMKLLRLPAGGMTEKEMIAEAHATKRVPNHSLAEYIKAVIALVKSNHFSKNDTWIVGMLEEMKDGTIPAKLFVGLCDIGEFYLHVSVVRELNR